MLLGETKEVEAIDYGAPDTQAEMGAAISMKIRLAGRPIIGKACDLATLQVNTAVIQPPVIPEGRASKLRRSIEAINYDCPGLSDEDVNALLAEEEQLTEALTSIRGGVDSARDKLRVVIRRMEIAEVHLSEAPAERRDYLLVVSALADLDRALV